MAHAEHKRSRRALLAGACAAPVLPLSRHCERSEAIQDGACTSTAAGLPRRCAPRNDGRWSRALARYARAEVELEGVAHVEDDRAYDRALGRHNAALARLLRTPAPEVGAAAAKLDLILRHQVFELTFGEACLAALGRDLRQLAGDG